MRKFVYPPRESVWALVQKVEETSEGTEEECLTLIQEAIYCMDGTVTPTRAPENQEEKDLMWRAFSLAHAMFLGYHY